MVEGKGSSNVGGRDRRWRWKIMAVRRRLSEEVVWTGGTEKFTVVTDLNGGGGDTRGR